jgi:hypothetical protein
MTHHHGVSPPTGSGQSICTATTLKFIDNAQSDDIPNIHVTTLRRQSTDAPAVAMPGPSCGIALDS